MFIYYPTHCTRSTTVRVSKMYIFGCIVAQIQDTFFLVLSPAPVRQALTLSSAMNNFALSAGLGAYVAALDYQPPEPQSTAMRKVGLRTLRECIVETYLRGAEAAGWPEHHYTRREIFYECLRTHCSPLPPLVQIQLSHAFALRVRDGRLPGVPAASKPKKNAVQRPSRKRNKRAAATCAVANPR